MIICVLLANGHFYSYFFTLLVFDSCFLGTSQEIGWEEHLQNDLFCVEWDAKP